MPEIELHIHTEDHQVHRVDSPDDLRVDEILRDLVAVLNLPPALPWSLYVKSTGRTLDPARSLKEGGVGEGEDLFLSSTAKPKKQPALVICKNCGAGSAPGSKFCSGCGKPLSGTRPDTKQGDLALHLYTPTGQKHSVRVTRDMSTGTLIATLISDLTLDLQNAEGQDIRWTLYDKEASRTLDPAKSLAQNGLTDGHHLYIRAAQDVVLKIEVFTPNGDRHSKSVPPGMSTREFIRTLVRELSLEGKVALFDKDTAKNLDPARTLAENGVGSGHHLHIKIKPADPFPWKWVAGFAAAAFLGFAIYLITTALPLELKPGKVSLNPGRTQQFRATTPGSNPPVTWSLSPAVGTISPDGLYTAPSVIRRVQSVRVTATTLTTRAKSGSAEISLEPLAISASSLTVFPGEATLGVGDTQKFTASVNGQQDSTAKWSLDPNVGVIAPDGTYTAPIPISAEQTITVKAVGGAGSTAMGTATVALKPLAISVNPATATLFASNRVKLHATVTGSSNQAVRWVVRGPGFISPNGEYFAPANVPAERTVVATAASTVDPTKSASAQILLKPTVAVSVEPPTAPLGPSGTQQFSAAVSGSTNVAVRWTLVGPGSLTNGGLYTAPASIPSAQNVQITATSVAQPSKFATATVSLVVLTLEITPSSATLRATESQAFRATVKGGTANLVWRLAGPGQLTSTGVYTAPSIIKKDETAHLTVYSSTDPSRQATTVIQLVAYHGPINGTIFWSGQVPQNGDFYITGNSATVGTVKGEPLPRLPVQIWLNSKDFIVAEMPGATNGFRLKMHSSRRGKNTMVSIGWTVQQP